MNEELLDVASDAAFAIACLPVPEVDKRELMHAFLAHLCASYSLLALRQLREMQCDAEETRH